MEEVFRQSKAFFALGMDDKMAVKADKDNRGYTRMHGQKLDPGNQSKGDTKVNLVALHLSSIYFQAVRRWNAIVVMRHFQLCPRDFSPA